MVIGGQLALELQHLLRLEAVGFTDDRRTALHRGLRARQKHTTGQRVEVLWGTRSGPEGLGQNTKNIRKAMHLPAGSESQPNDPFVLAMC